MRPDCAPADLSLPTLADEAVVEIHTFEALAKVANQNFRPAPFALRKRFLS